MKAKKILLSLIVIMALLIGVFAVAPFGAMADIETLNLTLTDGVLSWNEITGATGYQVVLLNQVGTEINRWDNTNTNDNRVLAIVAEMNNVKYDSGSYIFKVEVKGVSGKDATKTYYYTSNVEKLHAPTNLSWIGANAIWDFVDGADAYKVTLYNFEGQVTSMTITGEGDYPVDFSSYSPQDGWTFTVQALSNGSLSAKRNSTVEESPKKGSVTRTLSQVNSGNSINMSIDSYGVLTWDEVVGATGYLVDIMQANGVTLYTWENTNRIISLVSELDNFKFNSALYTILVRPQGVSGKNAAMTYYYTSNVERLPAPTGLQWIGSKAAWEGVSGASSYKVTLYNYEGQVVTQNITDCLYDFTAYVPLNGWTFTVQAMSNGTLNAKRNSNIAESSARDESYTVTIHPNNDGVDMPIVKEGQTGAFLLPECEFTAPSGKVFDCWAIGDIYGEQKAPGSAHILNSNLLIVALWKDKPFTVAPGDATLISGEGYTFDYKLSVDATQVNVQVSNNGGTSWENFSILAPTAPAKNTLTSGTIGCPAVGWTGEKLFRLNAWDSMSNQYYSDPFTVQWIESVFATQPNNVVVPIGKPALVTYSLSSNPESLNVQYEVSSGVWEHLQGTDDISYAIISASDEETSLTLRLKAIIDSNTFYSAPFTATWSNSAEEWAFNQEFEDVTLKVGKAVNLAWSVNFATTAFDICYWDGEAWDQYDALNFLTVESADTVEDYDFQENEKISLKFKIVAKQGDFTFDSNEFTINWVSYTVSFNGNGYQGIGEMLPVSGVYEEYVLPECNFVAPTGYFFKAWAVGSVEGTQYNVGDSIEVTSDVTVYAIWKELIEVASFNQLATALRSADESVGVKLTENITKETDSIYDLFEIASGSRYIDLNDCTLKVYFDSSTYKEVPLFAVKNSAKLTIVNGGLTYTSYQSTISSDGVILLVGNAKLSTEKVNITNDRLGSCVYARDDSTVVLNDGTITARQGYAVRAMHSANVTLDGHVELKTLQTFANDNAQAWASGSFEVVLDESITLNVKNALFSNGIFITPSLKSSFENHTIFVGGSIQNANFNTYANVTAAKAAGATYYWVEDGSKIYLSDASVGAYYPACMVSFNSKEVKYEIEVENGKASVGGNEVSKGYYYEEITITADEIEGKVFVEWTYECETIILIDQYSATTTFMMPDKKITFVPVYKNAPITYVEITFNSPAIGETLPRQASISHEGLTIATEANGNPEWDIEWQVEGAYAEKGIFLPGKTYQAALSIHVLSGDWAIDENVYVSINGIGATNGYHSSTVQVVFYEFTMPSSDFTVNFVEDGNVGIGSTLAVNLEELNNDYSFSNASNVTYEWYRDGELISGASGSTYVAKAEDANSNIFVFINADSTYYGVSEAKLIQPKIYEISIVIPDIEADCHVNSNPIHSGIRVADTHVGLGEVKLITWYKNGTDIEGDPIDYYTAGDENCYLILIVKFNAELDLYLNVGVRINGGALAPTDSFSGSEKQAGKIYEFTPVAHVHKYEEGFVYNAYDEEYHWKECTVTLCVNKEDSAIEYGDHYAVGATCVTSGTCICGKIGVYGEHDFENGTFVKSDEENHVKKCAYCEETNSDYNPHVGGTATCTEPAVCVICHTGYGTALTHDFGNTWDYKDALGHAHVCGRDGCGAHDTPVAHTPNVQEPTEEVAKECTACGYVIAPALNHVHSLTPVVATPATCTENGNSAYYTCACGQWFSDAGAENLIENHASVIIPALNHNYDGVQWSYDANEHYKVCSRDNCEVRAEVGTHSGGVADCQNKAECSVCHAKYGALGGHDFGDTWEYKDENGHAHKCTVQGCTAHDTPVAHTPNVQEPTEEVAKACTACGYVIAPALNHVHNLTPVVATPATCTTNGNSAYYTCTCGMWFSDAEAQNVITNHDSVIIPASHSHSASWTSDATNHWNECSCGNKANVSAHADENSDGNCDVCGYQMTVITPPAGGPGGGEQQKPIIKPDTDPSDEEAKEGLTAGAIAGIAVGATVGAVGLGAGGFAIFWFVIKKKSMAELLSLIKKTPKVNPATDMPEVTETTEDNE